MPTIVDMRPPTNTFRHATLIVIWLVAALIAMLLTIWDCDFKWVKIFLSIAAISTIGMIIVVTIKVMMSV